MKEDLNYRHPARIAACLLIMAGTVLPFVSCKKAEEKAKEEVAYVIGMEEYAYGYPLVMSDLTRQVLTAVPNAGDTSAPINQFARVRGYIPWNFVNVVRVSFNSLWSWAAIDLQEPVVVTFPDTKGVPAAWRVLNNWTDVIATGGTRQPNMNAGDYLIVGPGWNGTPPGNIKNVIHCSTRYGWFIVEMAATSPVDFPKIHPLQDELKVTPLSTWGKPFSPPTNVPVDPSVDLSATPYDQLRLMTGEMFFTKLAMMLKDNPPYPADTTMIERLKRIGVEAGKPFDPSKLDPGIRKGINEAPFMVWHKFATGPFDTIGPNGWGTILNIGRYGTDYATRAFVAYFGLGAGVKEDIIYPTAFVDGNGWALDGAHKYVVHFDKTFLSLPANGVWSISVYRENFYVHNKLERYGLPPGNPKYNPDGSLDVYLQADSPGPDKEANWLPTPKSSMFNATLRIYNPKPEALDPSYKFPPIQRAD